VKHPHPHPHRRSRSAALAAVTATAALIGAGQTALSTGSAQAATARQVERLDRGPVSVHTDSGNLVGWRWLGTDPDNVSFRPPPASRRGCRRTGTGSPSCRCRSGPWNRVWPTTDNTALRIYSTPYDTTTRITTLLHDTQYRTALAWQNTAYNQPPHPSFFIGGGMPTAPRPSVYTP